MRQTEGHRRRREQFMSDVLVKAATGSGWPVTVVPGGSRNGADEVSAAVAGETINGRDTAFGFMALYDDRAANKDRTELAGVSTAWRDEMIHARSINDVSLVSEDDARRVLALALTADR